MNKKTVLQKVLKILLVMVIVFPFFGTNFVYAEYDSTISEYGHNDIFYYRVVDHETKEIEICGFDQITDENESKLEKAKSNLVIPSHIDGFKVVGIERGAFSNADTNAKMFADDSLVREQNKKDARDGLSGTVTIPNTVEYIEELAFAFNQIKSVKFEANSNLVIIGSKTFKYNNIRQLSLSNCKKLETIAEEAFSENDLMEAYIEKCQSLHLIHRRAFSDNEDLTYINLPEVKAEGFKYCGWVKPYVVNKEVSEKELQKDLTAGIQTKSGVIVNEITDFTEPYHAQLLATPIILENLEDEYTFDVANAQIKIEVDLGHSYNEYGQQDYDNSKYSLKHVAIIPSDTEMKFRWYKADDVNKTNAKLIENQTSNILQLNSVEQGYYYCKITIEGYDLSSEPTYSKVTHMTRNDKEAPKFPDYQGGEVVAADAGSWEPPPGAANDNIDGNISEKVERIFSSDDAGSNVSDLNSARAHLGTVGNNVKVIYMVSDSSGNEASKTITYTSVENILTSGDSVEYSFNSDGTVIITGLTLQNANNLILPSKIEGKMVTAIGDAAFQQAGLSGHLTIPDTVTKIGHRAFNANPLTGVTIPNSVTEIGDSAFSGNYIKQVNIPRSVKNIGPWAFSGNPLEIIEFEEDSTLESIGEYAFNDHRASKVNLPSSVIYIGEYAFFPNYSNREFVLTLPQAVREGAKFIKWRGEKSGESVKNDLDAGATVNNNKSFEYSYTAVFDGNSKSIPKGNVSGSLKDSNEKPLIGYKVILHSEPMTAVTDNEGMFVFTDVEYTKHELIVETPEGVKISKFTLDFHMSDSPDYQIKGNSLAIYCTNKTNKADFSLVLNEDMNDVTIKSITINEKSNVMLYILLIAAVVAVVFIIFKIKKNKN